ncbi:VP5 protein [Blotched snakehead virus]|uniref:Protein VP5 n=1 Tax=Blotched snakehead virus TaxID=311176 RepID=VP5_BSNV|nr:VP5 protein [Blotched snakehead virus]Q8AZL9.1 RecName: Full=Protein VP5 [Blotched snakehead virus]CAD30690.1 VP5 protein [Blotched snakehead virus]
MPDLSAALCRCGAQRSPRVSTHSTGPSMGLPTLEVSARSRTWTTIHFSLQRPTSMTRSAMYLLETVSQCSHFLLEATCLMLDLAMKFQALLESRDALPPTDLGTTMPTTNRSRSARPTPRPMGSTSTQQHPQRSRSTCR